MERMFSTWDERIDELEKVQPLIEKRLQKIEEVLKTRKKLLNNAETELEKRIINVGIETYLNALKV